MWCLSHDHTHGWRLNVFIGFCFFQKKEKKANQVKQNRHTKPFGIPHALKNPPSRKQEESETKKKMSKNLSIMDFVSFSWRMMKQQYCGSVNSNNRVLFSWWCQPCPLAWESSTTIQSSTLIWIMKNEHTKMYVKDSDHSREKLWHSFFLSNYAFDFTKNRVNVE